MLSHGDPFGPVIHADLTVSDAWRSLAMVHVDAGGALCVADITDGVDECL